MFFLFWIALSSKTDGFYWQLTTTMTADRPTAINRITCHITDGTSMCYYWPTFVWKSTTLTVIKKQLMLFCCNQIICNKRWFFIWMTREGRIRGGMVPKSWLKPHDGQRQSKWYSQMQSHAFLAASSLSDFGVGRYGVMVIIQVAFGACLLSSNIKQWTLLFALYAAALSFCFQFGS